MAQKAQAALKRERIGVIADRGYAHTTRHPQGKSSAEQQAKESDATGGSGDRCPHEERQSDRERGRPKEDRGSHDSMVGQGQNDGTLEDPGQHERNDEEDQHAEERGQGGQQLAPSQARAVRYGRPAAALRRSAWRA
jgi:hypothetical protein